MIINPSVAINTNTILNAHASLVTLQFYQIISLGSAAGSNENIYPFILRASFLYEKQPIQQFLI